MSRKKRIGYSALTDKVYLGAQNAARTEWVGEKEDITNDFISTSFQFFDPGSIRSIGRSDGNKYLVINIIESEEGIDKVIKNLQKRKESIKNKK